MINRIMLCAWATALALPCGAAAQNHTHEQPTWVSDLGIAGANVMVGGLTAGLSAALRGKDVSEAFLKGAAGGGLVFLGKRTAVEHFSGAGLLGRELAGVGSSVIANGGQGRGWLTEVWLPVGPAWLQVRPQAGLRARLDLSDVGTLVWAATRTELHFDLERSISNGATVFVARRHRLVVDSDPANGFARGGVVVLGASNQGVETTQRHENVHVIQHDYLLQTMSRPLEQWGWRFVTDREVPVDLNLLPLPKFLRDIHQSEAEALQLR